MVSTFRLDKYPVTVGRFRQFVTAWNNGTATPTPGLGKHTHLNGGNGLNATGGGYESGWLASDSGNISPTNGNLTCDKYATWTAGNDNLPMNCTNWFESYAFCIWDGGFLPSQTEWEYAGVGGDQLRAFPWGNADPGMLNQYAIYDCYYPNGSTSCTGVSNIAPVGFAALGVGRWGQLDLASEVYEWTLDTYAAAFVDPCTDCANLATSTYRVLFGANFGYYPSLPRVVQSRGDDVALIHASYDGFRCARTP